MADRAGSPEWAASGWDWACPASGQRQDGIGLVLRADSVRTGLGCPASGQRQDGIELAMRAGSVSGLGSSLLAESLARSSEALDPLYPKLLRKASTALATVVISASGMRITRWQAKLRRSSLRFTSTKSARSTALSSVDHSA